MVAVQLLHEDKILLLGSGCGIGRGTGWRTQWNYQLYQRLRANLQKQNSTWLISRILNSFKYLRKLSPTQSAPQSSTTISQKGISLRTSSRATSRPCGSGTPLISSFPTSACQPTVPISLPSAEDSSTHRHNSSWPIPIPMLLRNLKY